MHATELNKTQPNWTYILISFWCFCCSRSTVPFLASMSSKKCYAKIILNAIRVYGMKNTATLASPCPTFVFRDSVFGFCSMSVAPIQLGIRGFSQCYPLRLRSFYRSFGCGIVFERLYFLNGISNRPLSPVWCASKYRQLNSEPHRARACVRVCVCECTNGWMYERSERAQD